MSDFNRNPAVRGFGTTGTVAVDAGLRAYMLRVYNYMGIGVAITGVVAWLAFQLAGGDAIQLTRGGMTGLTPFGQAMFTSPLIWIVIFAPLAMVFFISFRLSQLQAGTARTLFFVYAGLVGLSLATIFMAYTATSITQVFFITAIAFGSLSLYGYTTKRDLSPLGAFLTMGVVGLVLAMIVNMFFANGTLNLLINAVGVLIFAGLTAYDTQNIKEMYDPMDDGTIAGRKAVFGALKLYLDFLNIFIFLLQFLGDRRG